MRKQELIHLHGLLAEVSRYCEADDGVSVDLTAYREVGTRPTSIHESKTDHEEAVFALTEAITPAIRDEDATAVPASVD